MDDDNPSTSDVCHGLFTEFRNPSFNKCNLTRNDMEESIINEAIELITVKRETHEQMNHYDAIKTFNACMEDQMNDDSESEDSSPKNEQLTNPFLSLLDILPLKVELKELAQNFPEDHFLTNSLDIDKIKKHSHALQTMGVNNLKCEDCSEAFTVKLAWVTHMKQVHNNNKPFVCPDCGAGFGKTNALNTHIDTIHKKLRPYECHECSTSYGLKTTLTRHMLTVHSNTKPFHCVDCGASFPLKGRLTFHTNSVHRHIRPFHCSECGSSFSLKGDLKKHINAVHRGLKPFHCEICGNNFSRKSKLTSHVNTIHKRLRPFACEGCDATFTTKCLLTNHVNAKHLKLKPHECAHCDAAFVKRDGLKNHLKKSKCKDFISETLIETVDEALFHTESFLQLTQGFREDVASDGNRHTVLKNDSRSSNLQERSEISVISDQASNDYAHKCLRDPARHSDVHVDLARTNWTS